MPKRIGAQKEEPVTQPLPYIKHTPNGTLMLRDTIADNARSEYLATLGENGLDPSDVFQVVMHDISDGSLEFLTFDRANLESLIETCPHQDILRALKSLREVPPNPAFIRVLCLVDLEINVISLPVTESHGPMVTSKGGSA